MADDIINIATYTFDTAKLEQSLDSLQTRMFELRKEQEANRKAYNDATKEINELIKVNQLLTNANQKGGEAYKANEARIAELTKVQEANFKAQQATATQLNAVTKEYRTTNQALQALTTSNGQAVTAQVALTNALSREINTREEAKRSNIELNRIKDQLNVNIKEEADLLVLLNAKVNENNALLKESGSEREKEIANVGRYSESIQEAAGAMSPFNGGLFAFIQRAKEAGGAAPLLTGGFAAIRAGLIGATQAGIAFLATPIGAAIGLLAVAIGAIVGAFKFMTAAMNSTEEGSAKLAKVTGAITGVFNGLWKIVKPLGEFIGGAFIAYFELLSTALSKAVDGIAAALEFLGFDETAASLKGFKEEIVASSKAAVDLAAAELELDKAQRQAKKTQLEYQKEAEKLRQARDDESRTIRERIALNDQLGVVLQKQLEEELRIAQAALKVANLRIKSEGETTETLDEQAAALTEIADIEERIEGQRSEQLSNLNGLRREAAAQEKQRQDEARQRAEKAHQDALTRMQAELDLYIESQGIKKKSLEDSLTFEQNVRDRELAILKRNLEAKKITQEQYNAEALAIQNEFLSKQAELTIENAELELEMFRLQNERKLSENQYFSSELYNQELDRINAISEAEANALKLRLENGLINQKEYEVALLQLDKETQSQRDAAFKERETAQREKEAIDLENERIAQGVAFEYDLQEQLRRYDIERSAQREAAMKAGADMVAFDKATAEQRIGIERNVQNNIQELYADAFSNIATILGENTAAGKAAAIAEATISTYQAANKALAAYPPPFSYIAAGAAIATGLANVKKITAVKSVAGQKPKYARGGVVEGAGTGTSDSVDILAARGETIINANSSAMFSDALSAINVAGGGVPFANNPILQNTLTAGSNTNNQMAEMVAEAVAKGAAAGTALGAKQGISDLTYDRKVMNDAQF
jgi:hypothetical protein